MFNLVYLASLNLYLWNVSMNLWEPFDLWNIGKDLTLGLMHVNEPKPLMLSCMFVAKFPYDTMHVCGQIPLWYYACLWPICWHNTLLCDSLPLGLEIRLGSLGKTWVWHEKLDMGLTWEHDIHDAFKYDHDTGKNMELELDMGGL